MSIFDISNSYNNALILIKLNSLFNNNFINSSTLVSNSNFE